ncbi:phosphopentomutase [Parasulfitobacter algicola]|uniref:Phosphopentomutase n=1 Tax=Parasulfitobacter algicola TaxID=2614809 RepID=A0ABX2IN26_9RHOB|nr:phosphopentomutase [Sulfitobacter algicola]NSX54284.1 phosphopentomutase [Sulfitobacter algicola]
MARAFLVVMDSVGCGGAPDAKAFGDEGANTLAHIAEACAGGRADKGREGPLLMPNLDRIGLGAAVRLASGAEMPGFDAIPQGLWGAATEVSNGKDTPSGHWELTGVPVPWDWHYFPDTTPCFPDHVVQAVCEYLDVDGILGNRHASGTQVLIDLGAKHMQSGWPICYTSADSVFQIAAHEETFGLDRLLKLCQTIAPMLHDMKIGRVIARPFVGTPETGFTRTTNRHDYAIAPPAPTLCDWVETVHAIGKIGDIFSMQGITDVRKGDDETLMRHLIELVQIAKDGSLIFANFVEFDSLYGHRRDVAGYARALEWFDAQVPRILARLRDDDLIIFTADHGNDPTWTGTDHTRERVPVLGNLPRSIGHVGFADVAASIADHLGVSAHGPGRSFL